MSRRVLTFVVGAVLAVGLPAPAAMANEPGPCGDTPENHCRPMDCELVWNDPEVQTDIVHLPGTPGFKCYN